MLALSFCALVGCERLAPNAKDSTHSDSSSSPAAERDDNLGSRLYSGAEAAYQQGRLAEARGEAEAGYLRLLPLSPVWAGNFRLLDAQIMLELASFQQALVLLRSTPSLIFSTCELRSRREMLEAIAYLRTGNDSEAAASMEEAQKQCANPSPILAADLATRRGIVVDDWPAAEKDFRIALATAREQQDSFREAGALHNLGYATQAQEHYDESISFGLASLQISRRMGYKLNESRDEGNLAFNYYKLGDFNQALTLFTEAEASARDLGLKRDEINWRNSLGLVHEQTGQLSQAASEYRQVFEMSTQLGDEDHLTQSLAEIAFISIRTGEWSEAERFSVRALDAARKQQNRPMELEALLAQALVAFHQGDKNFAEKLLSDVARDPGHDRQSLRWEAQAALADLYAQEQKKSAAEGEYQVALNTVRQARCSVQREESRMPFFANATRVYDNYIDFLVQEGKTAEALRVADESRALTLAEGLGIEGKKCLASEATFNPERSAKQAGGTILFYWLGTEHSYLWAIGSERMKIFPLPGAAVIEATVASYRKSLLGSRDVLQAKDANGAKLYDMLVGPASEFFGGDGRVMVIADGNLSGLNFETLIAPEPRPHYWIEDVTLENASSLRLLAAAPAKRMRSGNKLLLMGNSVAPGVAEFGALPNAAKEMESVGKYFAASDEQVYEKNGSTAGAYLASHPEQFAYIHFVAHGTASLSDPLDSAVVLSPTQPDGAYKLYARDVITRPLNAELVTVSTCRGAGIKTYKGEGLVGLSWAFLHAGAHNVIGALWDVSDESTPRLMDAMYAELVKGSRPDAALRTAKLSLLRSETPFRKPYYWAAFQLYTGS